MSKLIARQDRIRHKNTIIVKTILTFTCSQGLHRRWYSVLTTRCWSACVESFKLWSELEIINVCSQIKSSPILVLWSFPIFDRLRFRFLASLSLCGSSDCLCKLCRNSVENCEVVPRLDKLQNLTHQTKKAYIKPGLPQLYKWPHGQITWMNNLVRM